MRGPLSRLATWLAFQMVGIRAGDNREQRAQERAHTERRLDDVEARVRQLRAKASTQARNS